jgi:hypothetical protein
MWDDEEFRRRVTDRAKQLGKSVRQVLSEAGMAHDTLKAPSGGRRIDTMERLARALDWSLPDIMGFPPRRVTKDLLGMAVQIARRALRYVQHDDDVLYDVVAHVYNVLADRQRAGQPIDDQATSSLAAYIAEQWRTAR